MAHNPNSDPQTQLAEDVFASCLEREESEWPAAIEEACSRHPDLAASLRRRLALIAPVEESRGDDPPRRLGDYELGPVLGKGGMGVVHLAQDMRLGRDVAVKLLRPELLWFEGARERFEREGLAVARLQHPGIVPVYSCGEAGGVPFYAMERLSGLALDEVLAAVRDIPPGNRRGDDVARVLAERCGGELEEDARARLSGSWETFCLRVLVQAADALAHAHGRGVLHRDLKPSNLMVRTDGRVQLLDFGLAVVTGTSRLTQTQGQVGSPPYMTPEQLRDEELDQRTDIYGLGVTAYELLTLHCPFLRPSGEATRRAILDADSDPLRRRAPNLSWELTTVVEVAMDPDPERRYPTAAALRDDLDRIVAGDPIQARRAGRLLRVKRWVQRHPTQTTALVLGFALTATIPTMLFIEERANLERERINLAKETELRQTAQDALASERAALARSDELLASERQALAQFDQLADQITVRRLIAEEQTLWPPLPARLGAMEGWLDRADDVLARRELHQAAHRALRDRAAPYTAEDQKADEATAAEVQPRIHELRRLIDQPMDLDSGSNIKLKDEWRREIEALRRRAEARTWRFGSLRDDWRHGELTVLLQELEQLAALQPKVAGRRDVASRARAETLEQHRDAWRAAAARVAADPRFAGYTLVPTAGLVPLGVDSDSTLEEFAVWCTGTTPTRNEDGVLQRGATVAATLILIPGGEFTIGSEPPQSPGDTGPNIDPLSEGAEQPTQAITLAPYLIGKYETHHGQWNSVMERNPSTTLPGDIVAPDPRYTADRPVDNISWVQAQEFCHRVGGELPTEAQWERAARAGTTTPWWPGGDPSKFANVGNICDVCVAEAGIQLRFIERDYRDGYLQAAPVGSYRANPFGLHDTIGNLDEWCLDALSAYTEKAQPGDGRFVLGWPESRITRGGNLGSVWSSVRSARRSSASMEHRGNSLGVRLAMKAPLRRD